MGSVFSSHVVSRGSAQVVGVGGRHLHTLSRLMTQFKDFFFVLLVVVSFLDRVSL